MRVLVCGGRTYGNNKWPLDREEREAEDKKDWSNFQKVMEELNVSSVISGGANGADYLALKWAAKKWIPFEAYPAEWNKYGKRAGYIRNKQMLDEGKPDLVVAFPGGKGTAMMVKLAKEAGVEVQVING